MDAQGKATVATICNYLQEAAGTHATALGVGVTQLFKKSMTWVLSRLHVKVNRYPHWQEKITLETWPSGLMGKFATRDFLIYDEKQNIIITATTSWMLIDFKKMRPITMPDFIQAVLIPPRARALDDDFPRLPTPKNINYEKQFDVRLSDLDMNQHVNHVKYIEWALESVPLSEWKKRELEEVEITFRSETKYGSGIFVQTEKRQNTFLHRVICETDQRELAVSRTHWRDK
jgi:acyl-ACP thioesterase